MINVSLALEGRATGPDEFVTLLYGVLNPESHHLALVNGGHPPALLRRAGERTFRAVPGEAGLVLGVLPDQRYPEAQLFFEPGDTLLKYSDGVTEAMSPDEREFGTGPLKELLARYPEAGPQSLMDKKTTRPETHRVGRRWSPVQRPDDSVPQASTPPPAPPGCGGPRR